MACWRHREEVACPARRDVHRPEDLADHFMGVGAVRFGHLLDSSGEEVVLREDAGVLREEAENQAGKEVVEFLTPSVSVPIGVVLLEFDIEPVHPPGRLDVEGVVADLLDGGEAREGQEEPELVREFLEGASESLAVDEVLGFDELAVRR